MKGKALFIILKILFSFGIIGIMLLSVDLEILKKSIFNADLKWFCLSIFVVILIQPIRSYRWGLLLWKKGVNVSFLRLLGLYFVGLFFSTFLPTLVGGDVVRGYYLFKYTEERSKAVASIILDRISGVYALALMSLVASLISIERFYEGRIFLSVFIASLLLLACLSTVMSPWALRNALLPFRSLNPWKVREKLESLSRAIIAYRREKVLLASVLVLSIIFNGLFVFTIYLLSISLGWRNSPLDFFIFVPMVILLSMFPLSLSGLGAREGALAFFMSFLGVPLHDSLSLSTLWFSLALIAGLVGGAVYLVMQK